MTQPNRISNFGSILVSEGISDSDYQRLQSLGVELEELYDQSLERAQRIDADPELASVGKIRRKKVLTREISESLEKYNKLANAEMEMVHGPSWSLELRRLRESLQTQPIGKEDRLLAFMEAKEIRDYLRSIKEPMQIEAAVRARAEAGDWRFLDSVKSAPEGPEKFLLPKSMELLEKQRLQSLNPTASARIAQIERSQRTLSNMVASLKKSLNKAGLFEEPEAEIEFLNAG